MSNAESKGPRTPSVLTDAELECLVKLASDHNLPVSRHPVPHPIRPQGASMWLFDADEVAMADLTTGVNERTGEGHECEFDEYLVAIMNAGPRLLAEIVRLRALVASMVKADPDWMRAVKGAQEGVQS